MELTPARSRPWHNWFAWFPVSDWNTGEWFWLETVGRKFRVDGAGARWYYRRKFSTDEIEKINDNWVAVIAARNSKENNS